VSAIASDRRRTKLTLRLEPLAEKLLNPAGQRMSQEFRHGQPPGGAPDELFETSPALRQELGMAVRIPVGIAHMAMAQISRKAQDVLGDAAGCSFQRTRWPTAKVWRLFRARMMAQSCRRGMGGAIQPKCWHNWRKTSSAVSGSRAAAGIEEEGRADPGLRAWTHN